MFYKDTGNIGYKIVNSYNEGIFYGGIDYKIGAEIVDNDFDSDETKPCAAGINLATLDWCMREYHEGYKILICEFPKEYNNEPNICIPIATDGKFRVKYCKVVDEIDLTEFGLNIDG